MQLEVISQTPAQAKFKTPLLFVHGAWHGAWCWNEHFLPWFAERGFEVHALSLRGHGKSDDGAGIRWHSGADYVADVEQIASSLATRPVIIGHSMGGYITQKFLQEHNAPAAVILASVPPHGIIEFVLRYALRHPLKMLRALLTFDIYQIIGSPQLTREAFFSDTIEAAENQRYFEKMGQESYRAMLDMLLLRLPQPKLVNTPMLVLGGEYDNIFSQAEVQKTAAAYHAESHSFAMAHDMMLEPGWEQVCERIIIWLKTQID